MSFPNIFFGPEQEVYNSYVQDALNFNRFSAGQLMLLADGRRFRFGRAGATHTASLIQQSRVPITNHVLQTPVAAAIGATSVSVALGATLVAQNDYQDGMLLVTAGNTGENYAYPIDIHAAVAASGTFAVPLKRGSTVQVAIGTTANSVSLFSNPFFKVIVAATTPTQPPVGVAMTALASGSWGWYQTRGLTPIRADASAVVVGEPCIASSTTAGNFGLPATASVPTNLIIGSIAAVGSSAHTGLVDLRLE